MKTNSSFKRFIGYLDDANCGVDAKHFLTWKRNRKDCTSSPDG